ncbi:MAG: hypothetical protein WCK14_08150 [Actinomycetota bacterium]|jgi:hypothetical protein
MAASGKRPFWAHQGAEYLIGIVFVAQGLQSPTPMVPTLLGGLVVLNTATAKGPLSAFQMMNRRAHRVLDAVLVLLTAVCAVQSAVSIEAGTRLLMGLLAFALGFIWLLSDFSEKVKAPKSIAQVAPTPKAAEATRATRPVGSDDASMASTVGRSAGRLVGNGVKAYRKRKS